MNLHKTATKFDNTLCVDVLVPTYSFTAQLDLYDDSRRDGLTTQRRILSTAPSVALPTSRTIKINDQVWILGETHFDYHKGKAIRRKNLIHKADYQATIRTISEQLNNAAGLVRYAGQVWLKSVKQIEVSSEFFPMYQFFFSSEETLPLKTLITYAGRLYIVLDILDTAGGFTNVVAEQIETGSGYGVTSITFTTNTFNAIADTYTASSQTVSAIKLRWQTFFKYETLYETRFVAGDDVLLVLKASVATVKSGDTITQGSVKHNVVSVEDGGTYWILHVRHA